MRRIVLLRPEEHPEARVPRKIVVKGSLIDVQEPVTYSTIALIRAALGTDFWDKPDQETRQERAVEINRALLAATKELSKQIDAALIAEGKVEEDGKPTYTEIVDEGPEKIIRRLQPDVWPEVALTVESLEFDDLIKAVAEIKFDDFYRTFARPFVLALRRSKKFEPPKKVETEAAPPPA